MSRESLDFNTIMGIRRKRRAFSYTEVDLQRFGKDDNTKENTMSRMDELRSLVGKSAGGVVTLSKVVLDAPDYASRISEAEFTELCTEQAKREFPSLARDVAFAKFFSAPENVAVRKAHALVVKASHSFTSAEPSVDTKHGTGSAFDLLQAKANELRKRSPELTKEQAFSAVFADPANRELAVAEREENRPRAGW
jgi:hypothetical protein